MEENLGEIIFDIMTNEYKDKVDKNKDIIDYLKDNTKNELLSLYLLYGYAGNNEYIVEEIVELQNKKKEETIKRVINFLDNQIVSILQFFNNKRIEDIKDIAYNQEFSEFRKNKENNISLDTIKILKQLKFIYCKKEKDGIIIHMPKFIRDKINNICGNLYLDYYEAIISYSKGIADTYGAIHIQEAYDIIKNDILIGIEETAEETMKLIKDIQGEMEKYSEELKEKLPKIYSKELLEGLFFEVYTKINYIENICGVTRKTAMSYLSQLEEAGFISSEKIGRDRIYKNDRLINLLKNK